TTFYKEGDIKISEVYGQSSPVKIIIHELDPSATNKVYNLAFRDDNSFSLKEGDAGKINHYQFGKEFKNSIGRFTFVANAASNISGSRENLKIQFHNIVSLANGY